MLSSRMDCSLTLCGESGITFGSNVYRPDSTKCYLAFEVSHSFPVMTLSLQSLHPAVIAKSWSTLKEAKLDFEHQIQSYHDDPNIKERIVGSVLDAEFPGTPDGGWKVQSDATKAPGIRGIAVVWLEAFGVASMLDSHLSGRKKLSVSMEVLWPLESAGYAVQLNGSTPLFKDTTPDDMRAIGLEYVSYLEAPPELQAAYSTKARRVRMTYKGRKVAVMMGGLSGEVHYAGLGLVANPAEREARITRVTANNPHSALDAAMAALASAFIARVSH